MDMALRRQNSIFGVAFNDTTRKVLSIIFKVLGVIMGCVFFWETLSKSYVEESYTAVLTAMPEKSGRLIIEFVKYCSNASVAVAMVAPFFYFRSTDKIVRYFNPIIVFIRIILSQNLIYVALGPSGYNEFLKVEQFWAETIMLGVISVFAWVMFFFEGRARSSKYDILRTSLLAFLVYVMVGLCYIPFSFPAAVFGPANARALDFSFSHRLIIYSTVVVPFTFMMLFRNKPYHVRWYLCLQLALASFFCFFRRSTFETLKDPAQLPLHLCNTGVIIISIAFIFRAKPAFYFAYLINILGAYFATFMPNKMGDIFYVESLGYWHNHLADVMIPMLAVGLKVFDRPKLKYVLYALIGFSFYFVIAAFMDAKYYYRGIDYFFLNSDKFTSYAKSLNFLRTDFVIYIPIKGGCGNLRILWLYWILVFIIYVGLTFGMWFAYSLVFRISDAHMDCHKKIVEKRRLAKERKIYLASLKKGDEKW